MLITFRTQAAGPITMFAEPAQALLKLMGQTGVVPGGVKGDEVARALDSLRKAMGKTPMPPAQQPDDDPADRREGPVALQRRAVPLIDLLERAEKAKADVYWVEGA
jgi:hypothetical protein